MIIYLLYYVGAVDQMEVKRLLGAYKKKSPADKECARLEAYNKGGTYEVTKERLKD